MDEERTSAGKYLTEVLENNDGNNFKILLNQWKIVDKKLFFKFILWSLRYDKQYLIGLILWGFS